MGDVKLQSDQYFLSCCLLECEDVFKLKYLNIPFMYRQYLFALLVAMKVLGLRKLYVYVNPKPTIRNVTEKYLSPSSIQLNSQSARSTLASSPYI